MAEFGAQWIREQIDAVKAQWTDGKLTFDDVTVLVKAVTKVAQLTKLSGAEKKALAMEVAEGVLRETNFPVLPDTLKLPFVGDVGADALVMRFLPGMIDLLCADKAEAVSE